MCLCLGPDLDGCRAPKYGTLTRGKNPNVSNQFNSKRCQARRSGILVDAYNAVAVLSMRSVIKKKVTTGTGTSSQMYRYGWTDRWLWVDNPALAGTCTGIYLRSSRSF